MVYGFTFLVLEYFRTKLFTSIYIPVGNLEINATIIGEK